MPSANGRLRFCSRPHAMPWSRAVRVRDQIPRLSSFRRHIRGRGNQARPDRSDERRELAITHFIGETSLEQSANFREFDSVELLEAAHDAVETGLALHESDTRYQSAQGGKEDARRAR
jgi:hypothetical protein